MDIVKEILLKVEALPAEKSLRPEDITGYDPVIVAEHVMLLTKEGYIEAYTLPGVGSKGESTVAYYVIDRLLNKGHDLLADARSK